MMHWIVRRTYDPVGMLVQKLQELQFRRSMAMAITHKTEPASLTVHDGCLERFKKLDFFSVPGRLHAILPVRDLAEAKKNGADGWLCCCPRVEKPISQFSFANLN